MSALSVLPPYPMFFDSDGQALEDGFVWIGQPNTTPQNNLIAVYFDEALSIPAQQPLRTINGYASRNGSPAQLYISSASYSISVQDKNGAQVYTASNVIVPILPINPAFNGTLTLTLDDNGATDGPQIILDRNSATPADNDELGSLIFNGRDSGAAAQQYAEINAVATVVTAGAEDGALSFRTAVSGTVAERARIGQGLVVGNPTGGDKGSNSINAANIYSNGTPVAFGAWGVMTLSADQTGIVAATRVAFNTIVTNRLYRGSFSPTNNRYAVSAPAPSVLITATLTVTGLDAGDEIILTIKSGLAPPTTVIAYAIDRNDSVTNALSRTISVSRMIALDTLDVVEVWLESSVDGCNVLSGAENSRFEIWEIGAGL